METVIKLLVDSEAAASRGVVGVLSRSRHYYYYYYYYYYYEMKLQ